MKLICIFTNLYIHVCVCVRACSKYRLEQTNLFHIWRPVFLYHSYRSRGDIVPHIYSVHNFVYIVIRKSYWCILQYVSSRDVNHTRKDQLLIRGCCRAIVVFVFFLIDMPFKNSTTTYIVSSLLITIYARCVRIEQLILLYSNMNECHVFFFFLSLRHLPEINQTCLVPV